MKSREQLEASIDRFRLGFWNRMSVDRPPVGVVPDRVWQPLGFLRQPFPRDTVTSADVGQRLARTEYEDSFAQRAVFSDDFLPYVAAWRAVPWLEAMCGCRVRHASGALAPEDFLSCAESLANTVIPAGNEWIDRLRSETAELAASLPDDCWLSPTILRGCSDVLAAMRGLDAFCLDLYDAPGALAHAAARVNALHLQVLEMHFSMVHPKLGGFGHIFGYWAPGPTTVLQEDAMGLCSPAQYAGIFQRHNAELVKRLGGFVLFHLHSTGYRHYRHVLDIPGIAGLELTVESNGPSLEALLPAMREILEHSRLILMVDAWFEQLPAVVGKLPREGLYLIVSDKFVADDEEFQRFVRANW